jgi:Uncharacterized protein, possibly involved in aromatic compounds catabolism
VSAIELRDNRRCFACGPDNPIGLHLEFEWRGDRLYCEWLPLPEHQGYAGITHGGLIATVLDEAMARVLWDRGTPVVTGSFEMRLRAPAPAGSPVRVQAWLESGRGRLSRCRSVMTAQDGTIVAEAQGSYVLVPGT